MTQPIGTSPSAYAFFACEVKYAYSDIAFERGAAENEYKVVNRFYFKDLGDYKIRYTYMADGVPVQSGLLTANAAPQTSCTVTVPAIGRKMHEDKSYVLKLEAVTTREDRLIPADFVVAHDAFEVSKAARFDYASAPSKAMKVVETDDAITVSGGKASFVFDKRKGIVTSYKYGNREILADGFGLRPNFWRAPTENDLGARLQDRFAAWRNPRMNLRGFDTKVEDGVATVTARYEMPEVKANMTITYTINGEGQIKVSEAMTADKEAKVSGMFRFGMRMELPARFNMLEYYGRGGVENYSDRKSCAGIGIYNETVAEQYNERYVRPQESGTRSDLRYFNVVDTAGAGLGIVAENAFSASAIPYSIESMDVSVGAPQRHSGDLKADGKTYLCFDLVQQGLGCINSWGYTPLPQYMVDYKDYTFNFIISPIR